MDPNEIVGRSAPKNPVVIGNATLYLGDCLEILPALSGIDAVITDPPYGMNWNTDSTRFSGGERKRGDGKDDWQEISGDASDFDPTPWLDYPKVVLWGANHYSQSLPVGTSLVWIKKDEHLYGTFLSDCELAWMKGGYGVYAHHLNFPPPSRMAENFGKTAHPCQKPIGLMTWAIQKAKATGTVLDPYMGSGTTGVACVALGLPFVGIEINPEYFAVAVDRLGVAHSQQRLFA
jgi:DNA modification methylase